jgi:hypothetical protein
MKSKSERNRLTETNPGHAGEARAPGRATGRGQRLPNEGPATAGRQPQIDGGGAGAAGHAN